MRDEDKPFILYRIGMRRRITPRNGAGWRLLIGWIALALPILAGFAAFTSGKPQGALLNVGLGVFVLSMAAWGIGGSLWMRARAEVVDIDELLKLKHERDAEQRRR